MAADDIMEESLQKSCYDSDVEVWFHLLSEKMISMGAETFYPLSFFWMIDGFI